MSTRTHDRGEHDDLSLYRKKRDFEATPEPSGEESTRTAKKKKKGELSFVVQRHDASHLHYDFRLELDGVLKSWATPKGPSMNPADKRLAVEVEDHPLEYGKFEGAIPEGHYGAGHVFGWDRGTWEPEGDPHEGLRKGKLSFTLHGKKLSGRFTLVRMRGKEGKKSAKHNWLLMKDKDESARAGKPVTAPAKPPSLSSLEPQLATLVSEIPPGKEWVVEPKLDGYRALAELDQKEVHLISRGGLDWSERFSHIGKAIAALPLGSAVFDGEVCALDDDDKPSFGKLQASLKSTEAERRKLVYFVFDLLFLDGEDLRDRPLETRKAMLESILHGVAAPLSYVKHLEGTAGHELFALACKSGLEGVVVKRRDRPYQPGRTKDWLKVKCERRQEMVIVGYSAPKGSRSGLGALLLGVHEKDGTLRYAGRVGTGFSARTLSDLEGALSPDAIAKPALADAPRMKDATWVTPKLVCEVKFTEWTKDGMLRHPVFLGLREDKREAEVVRERAEPLPRKATKTKPTKGSTAAVRVTHPERVMDATSGLTKGALAEYYDAIAERMLPYVASRPLALVREPTGAGGETFFQKQRTPGMPKEIHAAKVGKNPILYVEDRAGLISLVQFSSIELHGWGSCMPEPTKPNWIVMDLDPDETLPFSTVVAAAHEVRELLQSTGLESFVKTTGGKGLHVVAPVVPEHDFETVKRFTHAIALRMEQQAPKKYVSVMTKSARNGKIFVDYLRNGEGATAILPYSTRARPNAPVAMPVSWDDLDDLHPKELTTEAVIRLCQKADPWRRFHSVKQRIPGGFEKGE